MSKSDAFETSLLGLIFQNLAIANLGDATGVRGSTAAGSLYVSLHTADPGEAGTQATNEAAYTGYVRQAVARDNAHWTVTGNSVSPAANIDFPACTAAPGAPLTFFGIGVAGAGATGLLYSGPLGAVLGESTAVSATDVVTIPGLAGVAVGDQLAFFAQPGAALPAGIAAGIIYFAKTVAGSAVTLSATSGGATLDITGDGAGLAFKVNPIAMTIGVIPRVDTTSTIVED